MKIVIIGGGIAGLSIGLRLREAGCDVVVLERASPGHGATWASGGMIAAGAENADDTTAEARFAHRSAKLWPEFAAVIEKKSGQSISFRQDGSLLVAADGAALAKLSARNTAGTSMLSAAEAGAMEPLLSGNIAGALWSPEDGQVDNRAVGYALALAFVGLGGVLQINEAVVTLETEDGFVTGARTPFALYEADAFVIAAGAWSGSLKGLVPNVLPPVIPVKGEMLALRPPAGTVLPKRLIWGDEVYLIPRHDRLLIGATTSRDGFDTSTTRQAADRLYARACAVMPSLSGWTLEEHWAGLRPGSPDDLPIIGEIIPGLFAATGQYRNGILFAPAIADAMHSLIVEHRQPPEIRDFDPKRFTGSALADGG